MKFVFLRINFEYLHWRHFHKNVNLHGFVRLLVLEHFESCFHRRLHYPTLGGYKRKPRMYPTMRRHLYWSHMAFNIPKVLRDCYSFAENCSRFKLRRKVQLFPALGLLDFVPIGILGPLHAIGNDKQHFMLITARYLNQTHAIAGTNSTVLHIVTVSHKL